MNKQGTESNQQAATPVIALVVTGCIVRTANPIPLYSRKLSAQIAPSLFM